MAATLHDHCHLGTTSPPTSTTYPVRFSAQHAEKPQIVASVKRALSGKLHLQALSGASAPLVFRDYHPTIQVASESAKETIVNLLGKTVYYVPPYHDDVAGVPQAAYIHTMKMMAVSQMESSDPREQYWWITVQLVDAETYVA